MNYSPSYVELRCLKKGDVLLVSTKTNEFKLIVRQPLDRYSLVDVIQDTDDGEKDPVSVYIDDIEVGHPCSGMERDGSTCLQIGVPTAIDIFC